MTMLWSPRSEEDRRTLAWRRHSLRCVAVALAAALPCSAQSDTTTRIAPRVCWRGKPAPDCSAFWITEFGVDIVASSTQTVISENFGGANVYRYAQRDFDSRFIWTVGPMFNRGPRTAIGGTLSLSPVYDGTRVAMEGRRRWWKADDLALDLSAGALRIPLPRAGGSGYHDRYGLTAGVLVVGGDLINVNGRVDLLVTGRRPRAGASVGLSGGSYIAVAGTAALGLLIIAVLSAGPWD